MYTLVYIKLTMLQLQLADCSKPDHTIVQVKLA